jgi:hypothetical protein
MTTHIFVALGMWDRVVDGNVRARDTQDAERAEHGRPPNLCGHYSSWLHYGHLMLAQNAEAEALMDACHRRVAAEPDRGEWAYFVSMRSRHVVDTEDWSQRGRWLAEPSLDARFGDAPDTSRDAFSYQLTNAFAALRDGDPAPARSFVATWVEPVSEAERLQLDQVRGLLAIAEGRVDDGMTLLRAAAEAEDAMPYAFGPPGLVKPTFELLGEELVRAGRHDEAELAYRRAAERTPGRPLAVVMSAGEES